MENFLRKLSGKRSEQPTIPEAIQKLRELEDMLTKKQEYLESKIDKEILKAKRIVATNKTSALQALRRKKQYQKQLSQIDNTLTTIEMQRQTLEVAGTNTTVLKTMQNAAVVLKKVQNGLNVDKINIILDDIADQQELANEISNAIAHPVGFNDDFDEDELELELEALEDELLEKKLLDVPEPMASVSTKEKTKKKITNDFDDLKKLEEWAS